jgi:hypothetical protein
MVAIVMVGHIHCAANIGCFLLCFHKAPCQMGSQIPMTISTLLKSTNTIFLLKHLYIIPLKDFTMLKLHRVSSTSHHKWGHEFSELKSRPNPPKLLTSEQGTDGADSWVDVDDEAVTATRERSSHPLSCSVNCKCVSCAGLRCDTPTVEQARSDTIFATDLNDVLDTVTFSPYATHLLPSEPNGTWRTQASYALQNPSEAASTFREVLEQYAHEFDVPTFVHELERIAEAQKDDFSDWMNQALAGYDLIEMHNQVRNLVPALTIPSTHKLGHAVDTVAEIAQSLRKRHHESDLSDALWNDKYTFAQIMGQRARNALIDQGICKEWQFFGDGHAGLLNSMQTTLMHTFTHTPDLDEAVLHFKSKPVWVADRRKSSWRLELDIGVTGIEVGPESDRSLIELGFVDTGFELPESSGCVSITDLDRKSQVVEDEWQLLES